MGKFVTWIFENIIFGSIRTRELIEKNLKCFDPIKTTRRL